MSSCHGRASASGAKREMLLPPVTPLPQLLRSVSLLMAPLGCNSPLLTPTPPQLTPVSLLHSAAAEPSLLLPLKCCSAALVRAQLVAPQRTPSAVNPNLQNCGVHNAAATAIAYC